MVMSKHDINLINQLPKPDLNTNSILNHTRDMNEPILLKINGFKLKDLTPKNNPDEAKLILSVKILSDVYATPIFDLSPNGEIIYKNAAKPNKVMNGKGLNFNLIFYVRIIPFTSDKETAIYLDNLDNPEIYDIINYLIGKSYKHMKGNQKAIHINYKGLKNVLEGQTLTIEVIYRKCFGKSRNYLKVIGDNDEDQD